jgi:pectate lyase
VVSWFSAVRRLGIAALALAVAAAAGAGCGDVRIYPLRHGKPPDCPYAMDGWAKVPGDGSPTTGGEGGEEVVASTADELTGYASDAAPLVIKVRGSLALSSSIRFVSNKTIYGDPATPRSGVIGAGLDFTDASNIIIRNLVISRATAGEGDAITLLRSKHVWIDHCDLSSELVGGNYDGLVDITHASDYITISWTVFHDHRDTSLVGHSANNMAEDADHLTVTYHHNLFRQVFSGPRIRFGSAHIYNNQFVDMNTAGSYAVAAESYARVLVEWNHFSFVALAITTMYMDEFAGSAWDIENRYEGGTPVPVVSSSTPILVPPYAYSPDSLDTVEYVVPSCAGVGHLTPERILVWTP